jgi:hypothetical protein
MAALLVPFGNCVEVLNPTVVSPILSEGMMVAFTYVRNLEESDFKDKVITEHLHVLCEVVSLAKLLGIISWFCKNCGRTVFSL